ncbi:MAG: hypothetical protein N6V49_10075 [Serratia symbiotica]|nr:hypothetical protein [Serratia symbiotica]
MKPPTLRISYAALSACSAPIIRLSDLPLNIPKRHIASKNTNDGPYKLWEHPDYLNRKKYFASIKSP